MASPFSPLPPTDEPTLRQWQATVDGWIRTVGVDYFPEMTNLAILVEEVGELAREYARRFGSQSRKPTEPPGDLADETADVLFVLLCLANQTGVDLTDAMRRNLEKKTLRDADRHRNNEKLRPASRPGPVPAEGGETP